MRYLERYRMLKELIALKMELVTDWIDCPFRVNFRRFGLLGIRNLETLIIEQGMSVSNGYCDGVLLSTLVIFNALPVIT